MQENPNTNGKAYTKPAIVTNSGDLRRYVTEIPLIIKYLSLTPYEGWLYTCLKMSCSSNSVELSTRDMAELANMSVGKVSECKHSLKEKGLITVTERTGKDKDIIVICDLWLVNSAYLSNTQHYQSNDLQPSLFPDSPFMLEVKNQVTEALSSVHTVNSKPGSVHTVNAQGHGTLLALNGTKEYLGFSKSNTSLKSMNTNNSIMAEDIPTEKEPIKINGNADLNGLPAREIVFNSVAKACGYNLKTITAKDRAIIYNAVSRLFILNEGVSGDRIARRVAGFSLWQRAKESGGVNFDYPNPDTIVRKWSSYVDFVNDKLHGNLPTEETFKDLKNLNGNGNGYNGKVTGR